MKEPQPIPAGRFWLLMIATGGLYSLYRVPCMAPAVNRITGTTGFAPWKVFVVGLATVGLGFAVYEMAYARALERHADPPRANRGLFAAVLILNAATWGFAFGSDIIAFGFSLGFGCWATWLVQREINRRLLGNGS